MKFGNPRKNLLITLIGDTFEKIQNPCSFQISNETITIIFSEIDEKSVFFGSKREIRFGLCVFIGIGYFGEMSLRVIG